MLNSDFQTLFKFFSAGVLATATHYAVLFSLFSGLGMALVLATTIGASMGAVVNYFVNYFYTFRSQRNHWVASGSFLLVVGTGLVLNAAVVSLAFHVLALSAFAAQITATLITFIWNYQANRRWTF